MFCALSPCYINSCHLVVGIVVLCFVTYLATCRTPVILRANCMNWSSTVDTAGPCIYFSLPSLQFPGSSLCLRAADPPAPGDCSDMHNAHFQPRFSPVSCECSYCCTAGTGSCSKPSWHCYATVLQYHLTTTIIVALQLQGNMILHCRSYQCDVRHLVPIL